MNLAATICLSMQSPVMPPWCGLRTQTSVFNASESYDNQPGVYTVDSTAVTSKAARRCIFLSSFAHYILLRRKRPIADEVV